MPSVELTLKVFLSIHILRTLDSIPVGPPNGVALIDSKLHIDGALLSRTIQAVGRSDFYAAMLVLVGQEVRHDLLALARYSRLAPPDFIAPIDFDEAAKQRYFDGLYLLDPFYRLWQDHGAPGVVTLRNVAPADLWLSRYATEFLYDVRISDEVCVFLPPLGGASVALIVDRASGHFSAAEHHRVSTLYPVLAGLHELHVRTVFTSGLKNDFAPHVGRKPLRLLDHQGVELYVTPTWPADSTFRPSARHQIRLDPDFVLAPNGVIEYLDFTNEPAGAPAQLHDALARHLTPRERDIVQLTLAGYPTISIAQKLKLAVGSVKNHRTRIFRKLDITTERELFLVQRAADDGAVN
jgi:DNA-binding CsgD family transcriptional regulator